MTRSYLNLSSQELEELIAVTRGTALVLMGADTEEQGAHVGGLNPSGFEDLCNAIKHYWTFSFPENLNRYAGVNLDNSFYLLHAKLIPDTDQVLGVAFPVGTPFAHMREDLTHVAYAIHSRTGSALMNSDSMERSLQSKGKHVPGGKPSLISASAQNAPDSSMDQIDQNKKDLSAIGEWVHLPESMTDESAAVARDRHEKPPALSPDSEKDRLDLNARTAKIPWQLIEDRQQIDDEQEWVENPPQIARRSQLAHDQLVPFEKINGWRPLKEMPQQPDDLVSIFQDNDALRETPAGVNNKASATGEVDFAPETPPEVGYMAFDEESSPYSLGMDEQPDDLEVSDITFYLVPGQDSHEILGDLAQKLRNWLPEICSRYGWQLAFFSVRPDYIRWTLHDFPEVLTREMLKIIRTETSTRLFADYPELKQEIADGDYWSQGYLMDTQNREFSTQALLAYVSKARSRSARID